MEARPLGRTGLTVSALGFGAGGIGGLMVRGDTAEQQRTVARAIEAGITYFDTASMYGEGRSEENLGRVLRELKAWGRVVVGTKVRLRAEDLADPAAAIRRSCEASLRRLGHDSVDLMQLHNRIGPANDPNDPALDGELVQTSIAAGLAALVQAGLARQIGITGLGETASLTATLATGRFATLQSYFNPLNPSAGYAGIRGEGQDFGGLIDTAAAHGLGVIVIRPLAAGALGGQAQRHAWAGDPGQPLAGGAAYQRDLDQARRLQPLIQELGLENGYELALRFVLAKPGVSTVLIGYSDQTQLDDALRWVSRGPLLPAAVQQILAQAQPR